MKLTKAQRETVRMKFGGRCAYCGCELGTRWHADHFLAVERELEWVRGVGPRATGKFYKPQNDTLENLMPACAPCNLDKHAMTVEQWRVKLQDACGVLTRNHSTYRFALAYGLVKETGAAVTFYFERQATGIST